MKGSTVEKRGVSKWFSDEANWFVLFVQSREERRIAKRLQEGLDAEQYVVFVPTKDYVHKKESITTLRKIPWISGYVFIASTAGTEECKKMIDPLILNDSTIYRFLSNDGTLETAVLSEHDKNATIFLLDESFHVPSIPAEFVDDRISIKDNPYEKFGGDVVKANRHKQTALVKMNLLGRTLKCEIALEFEAGTSTERGKV